MRFEYRVTVEVEQDGWRRVKRAEIADAISEALEEADPQSVDGDNEGTASTTVWTVEEVKPERRAAIDQQDTDRAAR